MRLSDHTRSYSSPETAARLCSAYLSVDSARDRQSVSKGPVDTLPVITSP